MDSLISRRDLYFAAIKETGILFKTYFSFVSQEENEV